MKKMLALLTAFLVAAPGMIAGAEGEVLSNFTPVREYSEEIFMDVDEDVWYHDYVATAYRYGLANGVGENRFDPEGQVTGAEALAFASRIHSTYFGQTVPAAEEGEPWYAPYFNYAAENIITGAGDFNIAFEEEATRAAVAFLFSGALPEEELLPVIEQVSFADLPETHLYYDQIMTLCHAGVLAGDTDGNVNPDMKITRAECMTLISRMIDPATRFKDTKKESKTPEPLSGPVTPNRDFTCYPEHSAIPDYGSVTGDESFKMYNPEEIFETRIYLYPIHPEAVEAYRSILKENQFEVVNTNEYEKQKVEYFRSPKATVFIVTYGTENIGIGFNDKDRGKPLPLPMNTEKNYASNSEVPNYGNVTGAAVLDAREVEMAGGHGIEYVYSLKVEEFLQYANQLKASGWDHPKELQSDDGRLSIIFSGVGAYTYFEKENSSLLLSCDMTTLQTVLTFFREE